MTNCKQHGWHDCPDHDGRRTKHHRGGSTIRPYVWVNGERFAPGYTREAAAYEQRTRKCSTCGGGLLVDDTTDTIYCENAALGGNHYLMERGVLIHN